MAYPIQEARCVGRSWSSWYLVSFSKRKAILKEEFLTRVTTHLSWFNTKTANILKTFESPRQPLKFQQDG